MNGRAFDALVERKRDLRRRVLERRDALADRERREKSDAIAERVMALPEIEGARTVMVFWSFGSEVDTAPLIERLHDAGARIVLPRVEGGDVVAVVYAPGDPTAAARFGAMEPTGIDVVDPAEIDLVIAPGVAFDRSGGRVGYGAGFYDRYLARVRRDVPVVAVGFAVQLVDEVPRTAHDRLVDLVVTEDGTVGPGSARRG